MKSKSIIYINFFLLHYGMRHIKTRYKKIMYFFDVLILNQMVLSEFLKKIIKSSEKKYKKHFLHQIRRINLAKVYKVDKGSKFP
jgi:hypothetical protein